MIFPVRPYTVGVQVGNWTKYDIDFEYVWESELVQEFPYLQEVQEREWNDITVKKVAGTIVTIEVTTHLSNSTESTAIYQGDVIRGIGNLSFQIIAAGIQQGERIVTNNPDVPDPPQINKTESRHYAGALRETNFLRLELGSVFQEVWFGNGSIYDYYWDRETGFLCELGIFSKEFGPVVNELYSYTLITYLKLTMIETNLWMAGISIGVEWWLVLIAVIVLAASLYLVRTHSRKSRRISKKLSQGKRARSSYRH